MSHTHQSWGSCRGSAMTWKSFLLFRDQLDDCCTLVTVDPWSMRACAYACMCMCLLLQLTSLHTILEPHKLAIVRGIPWHSASTHSFPSCGELRMCSVQVYRWMTSWGSVDCWYREGHVKELCLRPSGMAKAFHPRWSSEWWLSLTLAWVWRLAACASNNKDVSVLILHL